MIDASKVPFYANTPDDTHCYQASLKMVIEYFEPERMLDWHELDTITNKPDGQWTWPMAGMTWLAKNGYRVTNIENFDYQQFIDNPIAYMTTLWGSDVVTEQEAHSDTPLAQKDAQEFIKHIATEQRSPAIAEIGEYLRNNHLVMCMVNAHILNDRPGYVGHSVVVIGEEGDNFIIHDPGLPAQKHRIVSKELFEKAWSDPNDTARNLCAVTR